MILLRWQQWYKRRSQAGKRGRRTRPFARTPVKPRLEALEDRTLLSTFLVSSTNDSGAGSLRQAILDSNADPGPNTIDFSIDSGVQTISPTSALPTIMTPVTIDATTQPGFAGSPVIELNGQSAGAGANGLTITAGNSTVRGLVINRFGGTGIVLQSKFPAPGGSDVIQGNYIGTDVTGTLPSGNSGDGVLIECASNNQIGGPMAGAGNVISSNSNGVEIKGRLGPFGAKANVVQGNYIGTDVTGTQSLANSGNGVEIDTPSSGDRNFASGNTIGGTVAEARNVISGNTGAGVAFSFANENLVQGNYIGTDVTGTKALGNGRDGIGIGDSQGATIGGTTAGAGNIISGNNGSGVGFSFASANVVQGNYIGTDVTGTSALGNRGSGVNLVRSGDTIGGTTAGAGNVISGNEGDGILLGRADAQVQGNLIGTDVTGTIALGNRNGVSGGRDPVYSHIVLGGTTPGARNVISGNRGSGVDMGEMQLSQVQGNFIGTDATGANALRNGGDGIVVGGTGGTTIGGTTAEARNVISGNFGHGVVVAGPANVVQGNFIGTDVTGLTALGNQGDGVLIASGPGNTIGGTTAGAGNVISGNGAVGVEIHGLGPAGGEDNVVQGNFIGTDATGTAALGNSVGVRLTDNALRSTIGGMTAAARNIISGNTQGGIILSASKGYVVQGNYIGTDVTGTARLANGGTGVWIMSGSNNLIGGSMPGAGNVISGNGDGVALSGGATGNRVQGNLIGTDVAGNALGNANYGVHIADATNNNTIGGTAAGAGNTIAYNGIDGVLVDTGTGNAIQGNSIFAHPNLGIELINNGNNLQPSPVVTSATSDGTSTSILGALTGFAPMSTFTIELFTNTVCNPNGGEGQICLGSVTLQTDGDGNASFTFTYAGDLTNQYITATATRANNDTSQFSNCVPVGPGPSAPGVRHTGTKGTARAEDFQLVDDFARAAALLSPTPSQTAMKWAAPTPATAVAPRLAVASLDQFFASTREIGESSLRRFMLRLRAADWPAAVFLDERIDIVHQPDGLR